MRTVAKLSLILVFGCGSELDYPVRFSKGCVNTAEGEWVCTKRKGMGAYSDVFKGERLSERAKLVLKLCNYGRDVRSMSSSNSVKLRKLQHIEDMKAYRNLTGENYNEYQVCRS